VSLSAYQSAARRVCFQREPSAEDLATLGSAERWLIYRSMVRARLIKVVHAALPRTRKALGEPAMERWLDAWLADAPPDTRLFREVPERFVAYAEPRLREAADAPDWVADLAEYEITTWRVKYLESEPGEVVEFHFDRAPAVNPTVTLLHLAHPVLRRPTPEEGYAAEETHLCVYRSADNEAVTWRLNPTAAALLEAWGPGDRPLSETVRAVTQARGTTLDQGYLEKLSAMLADFLERGILLGSRPG
jgi:hypothetical protein